MRRGSPQAGGHTTHTSKTKVFMKTLICNLTFLSLYFWIVLPFHPPTRPPPPHTQANARKHASAANI